MVWAIDLDDFLGTFCNEGKYPLINKLKSLLEGSTVNCPGEICSGIVEFQQPLLPLLLQLLLELLLQPHQEVQHLHLQSPIHLQLVMLILTFVQGKPMDCMKIQ
ncbi:unnamed protein product [Staurois parvus]|uniref:GH18 domain-containing protein n=1 Tax=Staurois parvus TaxID=386267 RepID=A0ABN9DYY5_9NEOB|nr:unnamed protein product [Staurois parvus]